ncbi:LysE family translocator [Pseudoteredinibacter isoporae]|uniref:Threonine/homoserine/homoserine lactone efflux protein n=1 Tax=Pseudoteredinibacter isoporae TaxID=570281 RepID=A0A7X0JTQ0_9GAMM|nr:LysE family translocator [Pseudoteredinibacter isoporae]MBB6521275.1 threonine/homoserine/homoserine lactone efflux protein [Pseudoteredinibacter isoporae]NHO86833.1 LysE family translocator [Pseudoteredinibacter isoporae]NIB24715.1 LysE family translocator [Pseudoteredinibacter isoporae]
MPSTEILIAFTLAALLMNISPGPSNLYVVARAIAQGTKGGIVAGMGLAVGSMVHVMATVLGLSAVFEHSPTLYTAVKLAGAAYLIYLGISYWQNKTEESPDGDGCLVEPVKRKPLISVFRESIIVEVTNPKTALFFIALLPQFVVPESGPISLQLLILGLIVTLSAIPCDIAVAVLSSKVSNYLLKNERAQRIQERVSGSILFGMGAYIVTDEARAVGD